MGGNTKEMKENMIKQVKQHIDKSKDKIRDQRSDGIEMVRHCRPKV
jgi:Ribosome recycling factor.